MGSSANPALDYALYYESRGFSVIPLPHGKKKPTLPWKKYQDQRANKDQIFHWFEKQNQNIGIVTGAISKLSVIDIDSQQGEEALTRGGAVSTCFCIM